VNPLERILCKKKNFYKNQYFSTVPHSRTSNIHNFVTKNSVNIQKTFDKSEFFKNRNLENRRFFLWFFLWIFSEFLIKKYNAFSSGLKLIFIKN